MTNRRSSSWFIYLGIITLSVLIVHRLNTNWDRVKIEPQSLVEQESSPFQLAFAAVQPDSSVKSTTFSSLPTPDFTLAVPATWSAQSSVLRPRDPNLQECINISASHDEMPLLVAKNYSPLMLGDDGLPYPTTNNSELTINTYPAHVSTMGDKSQNALIVVDAKDTYVLRSCPLTNEYLYLQVLKSFHLP